MGAVKSKAPPPVNTKNNFLQKSFTEENDPPKPSYPAYRARNHQYPVRFRARRLAVVSRVHGDKQQT